MKLHDTLSTWFSENKLMQLSTATNNQPWICTVGFATDDDFNLYWFSRTDRRHSEEIGQNSKVAATIVHDVRKRQAIQLTGTAAKVPKDQAANIHALYVNKLGFQPVSLEQLAVSDDVSFWRLTPNKIELWDEGDFPASPKQEYPLNS
jgi:uncharacterized protein YhbP (UPF0306 family)